MHIMYLLCSNYAGIILSKTLLTVEYSSWLCWSWRYCICSDHSTQKKCLGTGL